MSKFCLQVQEDLKTIIVLITRKCNNTKKKKKERKEKKIYLLVQPLIHSMNFYQIEQARKQPRLLA